jgi:hypothetical protein
MKVSSTAPLAHEAVRSVRAHSKLDTASSPQLSEPMDVQSLLLVSTLESRDAQESALGGRAKASGTQRDEALQQAAEARERAKQAAEEASKCSEFVKIASTVATVAAAAAAVASVVVTAGASAPAVIALAGVLLSASSPLVAKVAGDDAGKVAMWGGAAMSLGAGAAQIGSAALSTAAATGQAAQSLGDKIALSVAIGAKTTEGGARVAQGAGTIVAGRRQADVEDASADGVERRAAAKRSQDQVDEVIERLREVEGAVRRAIHSVIAIEDEVQGTRASCIARVGRSVVA